MKVVVLFLTVLAFCASIRAQELPNDGVVINIPGYPKYLTPKEIENIVDLIQPRDVEVQYFLYTKAQPENGALLKIDDLDSLNAANFDASKPTRFIIHGWINYIENDINTLLTAAILSICDCNVIRVDASYNFGTVNYIEAAYRTEGVGKAIAEFIDFLVNDAGVPLSTIEVYGHSLGGHVAGYVGKNVQSGPLDKIVALDPAGPLFVTSNANRRLDKNDANYVETIQTNTIALGNIMPLGQASFFVNGGTIQPGCIDIPALNIDVISCSHDRAFIYFAEAIVNNNFISKKCSSSNSAPGLLNPCLTSTSVRMGDPNNYGISGVFNVAVNSESPFGKGV